MNLKKTAFWGLKNAMKEVSPQHVLWAAATIKPHAVRTPILTSAALDDAAGVALHFKCEHLQVTGSFKARGALNAVLSLEEAIAAKGVVAHSTGNHGAAVAFAASTIDVPCAVAVPHTTPAAKVANVRKYGAEVVECDPTPAARSAAAAAAADRLGGATFVHPFDDARVIAGQGTIGLELLEDVAALDAILVPVSGGGMLAGIAAACAGARTRVVAVEPAGKRLADALAAGERCVFTEAELAASPTVPTIADAIPTRLLGEALAWPLVRGTVEDVLTVDDAAILDALRRTRADLGQDVEPAGAVALAGALSPAFAALRDAYGLKNVGVVVCGGNVGKDALDALLAD